MGELKSEGNNARPSSGRAFLSCAGEEPLCKFGLPDCRTQLIFWLIFVLGLILDLWSKRAVFEWLKPGSTIELIDGLLQLVIAENSGAAFGIAAGQRGLLTAMSVIALVIVFAVFLFGRVRKRALNVALGLLAAGICGNLYDRISNDGLVRDFIDVVYWPGKHWPAFNVADSMLCIGVGVVIFSELFTGRFFRRRAQQHK
jgi:signal peptidase II